MRVSEGEAGGREPGAGRVERPLPLALACCLAGSLTAGALGAAWALAGGGATWLALRRRPGVASALRSRGLAPGLCALLFGLAALRGEPPPERSPEALEGRWTVVREGTSTVGRLDGRGGRFEIPRGAAREGERLRLAPTAEPPRAARGPVPGVGGVPELPTPVASDEIVRLEPAPRGVVAGGREFLRELRRAGLSRIDGLEREGTRGLAAALLFGERGALPPEIVDRFTRTGTRHALALSGLHVGLVAALWIFPLGSLLAALARRIGGARGGRWLGRPAPWRALLLALFVPMAGAGAPVVRAALALALAQLAGILPPRGRVEIPRRGDALSLWALAGWLEWLASPGSVFSISVQLSYVATLGLILFARPLLGALRALLPGRGRIDPVGRDGRRRPLLPRIALSRALDWMLAGVAASVAANLATLPIVWHAFGEWSVAGAGATIAVLPLLGLFIGLAWLWLALPVWPLEAGLDALASGMLGILAAFDALPGTPVPLPERPGWLLAIVGAALFLRPLPGRALCLLWGILLLPWRGTPRALTVDLLDVGHGTALVLRAPGEPCWLFDAGSRDRPGVGRWGLLPLLRRLDPGRVAVVLSHTERDHAGALPWLVERYPPLLWMGALPGSVASRLPASCPRIDLDATRLPIRGGRGGDPALELRLIRGEVEPGNEGSRTLEVSWGGHRMFFCGDAEGAGLRRSLQRGELEGPCRLLLFPHHGSDTGLLGPLLEALRPEEVWISCGEEPAVGRELDRRGTPWRGTWRDGPLHGRWAPAEAPADPRSGTIPAGREAHPPRPGTARMPP